LEVAAHHYLAFLALDVEADARVQARYVQGVKFLGRRPWIYTSISQWRAIMGNDPSYSSTPLWDAGYPAGWGVKDWPTDLHARWTPYGGWSRRAAWQWKGTTILAKESFDLNVVDSGVILGER
jgi:hypothetical protein